MSALDVDRDLCIGAGQCVMSAPDHFDQDDDGLVVLSPLGDALPGAVPDPAVLDAARLCPSGALRLHDQHAHVPSGETNRKDDA